MQNKTKENDVNTLVKYDMPWPCLNILPNCDHTKIMCPNCAHQTGMLYRDDAPGRGDARAFLVWWCLFESGACVVGFGGV